MDNLKLGPTLKKLLKEKKMSVRKAAAEIGIPQATLNSIVNGRVPRKLEYIIKIAAHFNLSLDEMLLGKSKQTIELDSLELSPFFDGLVRLQIHKVIGTKSRIKGD